MTVKVRLLKRKHNNIQTLVQVPDKKDVNEKEDIVMSFSQQIENFHAHFTALMEEIGSTDNQTVETKWIHLESNFDQGPEFVSPAG